MNSWDLWSDIFGIICVVGPILLVVWYFRAAKEQLRKLNENENGSDK